MTCLGGWSVHSAVNGVGGCTVKRLPWCHVPVHRSLDVILRGMDKIETHFGVLRVPEDPVPSQQTNTRWPFMDEPTKSSKTVPKRSRGRTTADAT
jgi:hypothetical protein